MSNIGLMEGAFFVGRKEIMDWVNSTLDLNLIRVEDTASGAVACQIFDIMYPGVVPMHKVDWTAKKDFEFIANYKILQNCFTKMNIERRIDVDRLISGRYMDNLEFLQWYKRFYEMKISDRGEYDCYGQRCKGKGGAAYCGGQVRNPAVSKPTSAPTTKVQHSAPTSAAVAAAAAKKNSVPTATNRNTNLTTVNQENAAPNNKMPTAATTKKNTKTVSVNYEIEALNATKAYEELRVEMDGLEQERDFYFEKLRDIEVLLQQTEDSGEGNDLTAAIFKILYATKDGFENVSSESPAAELIEETY
eukprot:gene5256-7304_t